MNEKKKEVTLCGCPSALSQWARQPFMPPEGISTAPPVWWQSMNRQRIWYIPRQVQPITICP